MKTLVLTTVLVAAAAASQAQMRTAEWPQADLEAGWAYLHDDSINIGDVGGGFPLGWYASGSYNLQPALALVADAGGSYKSDDVVPGSGEADLKLRIHGLHAGVRFTGRGELRPYAQVLAGVTRATIDVAGVSSSVNDFSLQPGVGIMVPLGESISLGVGADYRLVFSDVERSNEVRARVGIVFHTFP